jgi:sensor histidine kinase YesM
MDFNLCVMFTHRLRYWFALALSLYTYANTEFCRVYDYFQIRIDWYMAFLTVVLITFGILEINRWIEPIIRKRTPHTENSLRFPTLFFLGGSIASTVFTTAVVLFMGMVLHSFSLEDNFTPLKLNLTYGWLVNLLYHLINAITYYFKEYKTSRLEAEELKRISAQAELQLVKSQINPHFLFNNLNVLAALVMKDNTEANRFIEAFSKVYRYILSHHDKELVDLRSELDFIKPYIFLLEKRFAEGLQINIDIAPNHFHKHIIPASLQMLIENAIKHNIVSRQKPLHINIHANGSEKITVSNNVQPKESLEVSTGIGLQNIIKRYQLVGGGSVDIVQTDERFEVAMPLVQVHQSDTL